MHNTPILCSTCILSKRNENFKLIATVAKASAKN